MKKRITVLLLALLLMAVATITVSAWAQADATDVQQVTEASQSCTFQRLAVSAAATLGVLVLAGSLVIVLNKKESHSTQASQKTKKQTGKAEVRK